MQLLCDFLSGPKLMSWFPFRREEARMLKELLNKVKKSADEV